MNVLCLRSFTQSRAPQILIITRTPSLFKQHRNVQLGKEGRTLSKSINNVGVLECSFSTMWPWIVVNPWELWFYQLNYSVQLFQVITYLKVSGPYVETSCVFFCIKYHKCWNLGVKNDYH